MKSKKDILIFTYIFILCIAEYLVAYSLIVVGLMIHAFLLICIVIFSAIIKEKKISIFLQALALVSLLRIVSVSIPLIVFFDPIPRFFIVYLPIILAVIFFIYVNKIKIENIGITFKNFKFQVMVGLTGIYFGTIEYFILKESIFPLEEIDIFKFLIFVFIVMVFTGLTEELIFRGILLKNMLNLFSTNKAIIFTSIIFMLLHFGWKSYLDLIFVFFISLFYCYIFIKTKSIVGVALSHGITNVVEFIILPIVITYM